MIPVSSGRTIASMDTDDALFGPAFARRLERLQWILRRRLASGQEGDVTGRRKGGLIEFADHREYVPGDDLKYVDWNAYLRLNTLAIKEFAKEEEVPLTILVDVSASMGAGSPGKFRLALQSAAGLGFVSLASGNPVRLVGFRRGRREASRIFRGKDALFPFLKRLEALSPAGRTDIEGALKDAAASMPPRGQMVLLSDLMEESRFLERLGALSARNTETFVLRILAPPEISPPLEGRVTLVDSETGETLDLDLAGEDIARFHRDRTAREESLRRFLEARGIRFASVKSDAPFEDVVLKILREARWFRFKG